MSNNHDSQPGLGVIMEREGLELMPTREGRYSEAAGGQQQQQQQQSRYLEGDRHAAPQSYASSSYRGKPAPLTYSEDPRRQKPIGESCRTLWLVLAIVIGVLVVVGAIVGGVVGSREMKKTTSSSSSSSSSSRNTVAATTPAGPSTSSTPAVAQSVVRANTPITATGWREGAHFHIWVFYQGPDGVIKRSRFSSEAGKGWSKPENFTAIKTRSSGTPLTATTNLQKTPPEVNLYYVDPSSQLRGYKFQESSTGAGSSSSSENGRLNSFPFTVPPASKLSAWWPVLASQNPDGTMQYFRDLGFEGRDWENYTFSNADAVPGTGIVMLPTAVAYKEAAGFLYVNNKGVLSTYLASSNNTAVEGWAWGAGPTNVQFPTNKTSPIGAFAYGRTKNLINTVAVFQGDDGRLYEARQDEHSNGSEWRGPTANEVLGGAKPARDTDIACVTMALWELSEVRLVQGPGAADMNRCYFQGGEGGIREVWFDGKAWNDLGSLPLG